MKTSLAAAALLLLTAAPVMADDENNHPSVYLGAGYTVPMGDLGDIYNGGLGITGGAAIPFSGMWGLHIEAAHESFKVDGCESCDKLKIWDFTAGPQVGGNSEKMGWALYTSLGAHIIDAGEHETKFGFGGGFNWHYNINETWGIAIDVPLRMTRIKDELTDESSTNSRITPTAGLMIHLGH